MSDVDLGESFHASPGDTPHHLFDIYEGVPRERERVWVGQLTSQAVDAWREAADALTRLQAENAKLREALAQASTWFSEYASSHADKGAAEKAQRNRDRADFCFTAHRRAARALASKGGGNG